MCREIQRYLSRKKKNYEQIFGIPVLRSMARGLLEDAWLYSVEENDAKAFARLSWLAFCFEED